MSSSEHASLVGMGQRLKVALRNESALGLIIRVWRKLTGGLLQFERIAFYEQDLTQVLARFPLPVAGVQFIVALPHDLLGRHRSALEADFGVGAVELNRRVACSHAALLGLHEGNIVAMLWLAFDEQRVGEIGRTLVLRPREVLTYNEFTLPAWRGRGISPCLNQFAHDFALGRGALRRINWRSVGNAPAIRVANKLTDRLIATVAAIRVLGFRKPWLFGAQSPELAPLWQPS